MCSCCCWSGGGGSTALQLAHAGTQLALQVHGSTEQVVLLPHRTREQMLVLQVPRKPLLHKQFALQPPQKFDTQCVPETHSAVMQGSTKQFTVLTPGGQPDGGLEPLPPRCL